MMKCSSCHHDQEVPGAAGHASAPHRPPAAATAPPTERAARHTLQVPAVPRARVHPPTRQRANLNQGSNRQAGEPFQKGSSDYYVFPYSSGVSVSHIYDLIYIATYNVLVYTSSIQVYMQFATFALSAPLAVHALTQEGSIDRYQRYCRAGRKPRTTCSSSSSSSYE